MSAQDREKQVVDAVTEAVPLVCEALGATAGQIGGGWARGRAAWRHVYSGGGTISAPEGDATPSSTPYARP